MNQQIEDVKGKTFDLNSQFLVIPNIEEEINVGVFDDGELYGYTNVTFYYIPPINKPHREVKGKSKTLKLN